MKRVLLGLVLLMGACGDDGPDGMLGNNTLNNPTNNESNNNETNNNETNNNETNNNETNNNETNNNETNNQSCTPTAGGIEICDGLDNDCNGLVDDSPAFDNLGESCWVGTGACEAEGVFVCSVTKTESDCDAVEGEPTTEVCDGIDNDCDGEIDEGFGLGDACSAGDGPCANDGVVVCMEDGTSACNAVAGVPDGAELCNAMDDDCDGSIDEDFPTLGESCTEGLGVCAATGVRVCSADQLSVACSVSAGAPSADVCDGLDNDCDGDVDEDFPTLGQPCTVGVGACAASGVYVCSGDQMGVVCSVSAGAPTTEICDGVDNDCDGDVDEGFDVGQACTAGMGLCLRSGQIACMGNGTSACSVVAGTPPEVNETTCDGLDNDCDGLVDENCDEDGDGYCKLGFARIGTPAVCPLGGNDCNDNNDTAYPGATEVCDGIDNNCNGSIDVGAVDAQTFYLDCDGDGYAGSTIGSQHRCSAPPNSVAQSSCGAGNAARWVTLAPVGADQDCQDFNSNVRPDQTEFFTNPINNPPTPQRNFDYNCSGANQAQITTVNVSPTADCPDLVIGFGVCQPSIPVSGIPGAAGWTSVSAPNCGTTGQYTYCSYPGVPTASGCPGTRIVESRIQACR